MSLGDAANFVFDEVRQRYKASPFKSTNKGYDLGAVPDDLLPKRARRNVFANAGHGVHGRERMAAFTLAGSSEIPAGRPAFIATGHALWRMNAAVLNCSELASMACYRAEQKQAHSWLMDLDPMDHALCVIGTAKAISAIDGKTVRDLSGLALNIEAYAVDVWLNICCPVRSYAESVSEKLERWTQVGKRVSWVPENTDIDRWDRPNGDYRETFLKSRLSKSFE